MSPAERQQVHNCEDQQNLYVPVTFMCFITRPKAALVSFLKLKS